MSADARSPSAASSSRSASVDGSAPSSPMSASASAPASPSGVAAGGKPKKCRFNDCDNLAVDGTSKCAFHKNRRQCCVAQCTNQVYARKLCVRHGGKKQCQAESCEAHARGGGFCLQHGGFVVKRFCIVEGCSKQAHARQKCVRHGGGRRCKVDGCMQHARAGGLCNRHSHGHECRVEGCNKTAQHSGSICFRHAMELRAHGEDVPELNISKGGRLSSKKRQQLQREQQMKQEQFHHQQIQHQQHQQQFQHQQHHQQLQQLHAPPMQPHGHPPLSINVPAPMSSPPASQQQQQQQAASSAATSNPFGLPLKIHVPTTMPKFSLRTPLGGNGFPTPRSHEFSLLMGLPSPQIDNSQLPSVLAMTNANASASSAANASSATTASSGPRTPAFDSLASSFLANGPPSLSRGMGAGRGGYLSLGLFPTPTAPDSKTPGGHDEDIDAIINSYNKFMGPEASASPIAFHHQQAAAAGGAYAQPPLLDNIGLSVFDHTQHGGASASASAAAGQARSHLAAAHGGPNSVQRLKMDFLSPRGAAGPQLDSYPAPGSMASGPTESSMATTAATAGMVTPGGSADYAAQFFADTSKADKARAMKSSAVSAATTPKPTGVTAA